MGRVLVVGLDGLDFGLVERWRDRLPNVAAVMDAGVHGPLESIVQPVTPVAWPCMVTGRNPGWLGFTDFLHRDGNSYDRYGFVHSGLVTLPTVGDLLAARGKRVLWLGVPIGYPPKPLANGVSLACFMAPSASAAIVEPRRLQQQLLASTPAPFLVDVTAEHEVPRTGMTGLRDAIRELDRQRFDVALQLVTTRPWDLTFMVCMGTDRIAHYFMRYLDHTHPRHVADPVLGRAVEEHYAYCDERLGELVAAAGDDTTVIVVSDHGLQSLHGKVNLNDWLLDAGYLVTTGPTPSAPTPLRDAGIDWGRTRAWARGYGGQIHFNVLGREPDGAVDPADVPALADDVASALQGLRGPAGETLVVDVIARDDVHHGPRTTFEPDLFVQVEGLRYTSSDSLGHGEHVSLPAEDAFDMGAHAPAGFFAMSGRGVEPLGRFAALDILDVAPTILELLDAGDAAGGLDGEAIRGSDDRPVYSREDELALTSRLRALYLE